MDAMEIQVEANPNCARSEQYMFNELEAPRKIRAIRVEAQGEEILCDVTGADEGGRWVDAWAVKITDSGAGYAYCIYGGAWGIRLKPRSAASEPWDLSNARQWGEPFKIYGEEKDIVYAES